MTVRKEVKWKLNIANSLYSGQGLEIRNFDGCSRLVLPLDMFWAIETNFLW